jgi:ATP-dependent DNA ligase
MAKAARAKRTDTRATRQRAELASPPTWIRPQLAKLVATAPDGSDWLHEMKLDGYRMHARLDSHSVQILTSRGNDWTEKYPAIAKSIARLPAQNAYLDGELCGVLPDGRTAFNLIQNATDTGEGSLVFFLFDLLFLDGEDLIALPLLERKARLEALLKAAPDSLRYNDHQLGHGPTFYRLTCQHGVEGIVSKRIDGRYEPDRRTWLKTKCSTGKRRPSDRTLMTGGRFGWAGGKPHRSSANSFVPSSSSDASYEASAGSFASRRITGARSVGQISSRRWRFGIASGRFTGMRVWLNAAR